MRIVCGMTAGAADSKISNQPVTFESNRIGSVRFEFESNLEYSQVPNFRMDLHFNLDQGILFILCLSEQQFTCETQLQAEYKTSHHKGEVVGRLSDE